MKKIKLTENELTKIISKIIKEQSNLSYDEFLEEMLQRGQNLIKLVEVIRKGNPNEMSHWDVKTQERALGEFREVSDFTRDLINEFKPTLEEQYTPEERVTDNQCVGTATDRVVLEVFDELTEDYGYECVGRIESTTGGANPTEINKILLKKSIQGIVIYLYIDEHKWVSEVGTVTYYIPNNEMTKKLQYRTGEGKIKNLSRDLKKLEDGVWDAHENDNMWDN